MATEWAILEFRPYISAKISSFTEVLENLDPSTNPSYPWLMWFKTKFETLVDPYFRDNFRDYLLSQFTDDPMRCITKFALKAELKKISKLYAGEQRVFTMSPLEHCIAVNLFDLDCNKQLYDAALYTSSCCGLATQHHGFDAIIRHLSRFPFCYEYDCRFHEMTFGVWLHKAVFKLRQALFQVPLTLEQRKAHWNLTKDKFSGWTVNSEGKLFWLNSCNKSGQSSTLVDNTFGSLIRLYAIFIRIFFEKFGYMPNYRTHFTTHVAVACVGDDINFSTDYDWFTFDIVSQYAYTMFFSVFVSDHPEPRPACEVPFLSQVPVKGPDGCWQGILDRNKMLSSLVYSGEDSSYLNDLIRLFGLRNQSGNDLEFVAICDEALKWFAQYFPLWQNDPEFHLAMSNYLSPQDLYDLWHSTALKARVSTGSL